jgi:hypothetical protein
LRRLLVKTMNDLIDRVAQTGIDRVIPFVWGGSSFVFSSCQSDFYQEDGVWRRKGEQGLYTGYDCSEFVMRMAQIVGISFPWKTSAAIQSSKRAFTRYDVVQEGDLIWIPGHVMVISNVERNELIESRSYSSGYGCVHRSTLSECFEGVETYEELLACYYEHKTIRLKNKQKVLLEKTYLFKLLKLMD